MQIWETLLSYALEQIEAANLPEDSWILGVYSGYRERG